LANFVPQPLQAETPDSGGQAQSSAGPSPKDNNSDGSVERVLANGTPYGEADTVFGGQVAVPGNLLTVANVASKAWSGVVSGVRQAGATVDIGSVVIGGAVTLSGLHWNVAFPSGTGAAAPVSDFQLGKVTVGGQAIPSGDLSAVGRAIDQALAPIGIQVVMPAPSAAQGTQFESPLQIEVVPSDARDQVVDPVITNGVEPGFYPVANGLENGFANTSSPYNALAPTEKGPPNSPQQQLLAALCQSDTPITVLDVTMASFTAGGYFNIALGGVNASSGALPANQYNLSGFSPYSLPGSTQVLPGSAGSAAVPAGPSQSPSGGSGPASAAATPGASPAGGSPSAAGTGSAGAASQAPVAASPAAAIARAASGPLLAVGLGILGLLLLLAEADRRVIRRTTPSVFEE
jgi:hypothetical protein